MYIEQQHHRLPVRGAYTGNAAQEGILYTGLGMPALPLYTEPSIFRDLRQYPYWPEKVLEQASEILAS